jgi:hypothetical protein
VDDVSERPPLWGRIGILAYRHDDGSEGHDGCVVAVGRRTLESGRSLFSVDASGWRILIPHADGGSQLKTTIRNPRLIHRCIQIPG